MIGKSYWMKVFLMISECMKISAVIFASFVTFSFLKIYSECTVGRELKQSSLYMAGLRLRVCFQHIACSKHGDASFFTIKVIRKILLSEPFVTLK
jgi:hypothetical protein